MSFLLIVRVSHVAERFGKIALQLNRRLIGSDCFIKFSLVSQGDAKVVIGVGLIRVEFYGARISRYGLIEAGLCFQRVSEVEIDVGRSPAAIRSRAR